jgi:zinc protease
LPYFTCFLASPSECTKKFVQIINEITRQLLPGPFTDTIWGILTGPDLETVLEIAKYSIPLKVKNVLACCPINLSKFCTGKFFSETKQKQMFCKKAPSMPVECCECMPDTTSTIVELLNSEKIDLMVTSGHASEKD